MKRGLFFTGTGTEVGKTYVTALAVQALVTAGFKVGVYKPVASGCRTEADGTLTSDDALALWEAAGRPGELAQVCPQRFAAPLAPHLAAKAAGQEVDAELLRSGLAYWQERSDIVLVEGAGGLMSPLTDDEYNADLAADFGFPLVVVAANMLGTINHTLQTLIAAAAFGNGLPVAGVVLNNIGDTAGDISTASNLSELKARCVSPVLGQVAFGATSFAPKVPWQNLASGPEEGDEEEEDD
jgi:dethiobiotin synthetase